MIDINVTALTRLTYAAVPAFIKQGGGTLINIASIVAVGPEILNGVYGATKAYVLALTQSLQHELASQGIRVIAAGLDMDYQGRPFGPMPRLMAMAEYVTKVHAICMQCGELANFSHRKTASQDLILLGETDSYEPLCRACFLAQRQGATTAADNAHRE